MNPSSKFAIERAVTGVELPQDSPVMCSTCRARLREGQPVTAAVRQRGESYHPDGLFCPTCAPRLSQTKADHIVEADIGLVSDVREQRHYPVLVQATVVEELVRA